MKKAVAWLQPYMEADKAAGGQRAQGKVLLATVKGDVHDIGKNIVGVVLGLQQLRGDRPRGHGADEPDPPGSRRRAGGHHRPERPRSRRRSTRWRSSPARCSAADLTQPLLIGGATTSRQHTAVKIAPEYSGPTVYVPDASRVTDVVASLLKTERRAAFEQANRAEQEELRRRHAAPRARPLVPYAQAAATYAHRLVAVRPAAAVVHRPTRHRRPAARRPAAVHRLDVLLRGVAG